ncbi:MAG: hypothetical protein AB7U95_30850, partial [Reyranella sp.]
MGVNPADLATVEEKLDLISTLWDSIEASAKAPPLTQAAPGKKRGVQSVASPAAIASRLSL